MRRLRDKKALVTGAASGLGRTIALRLAREGVHVYLLDIDGSRLSEVAAEARRLGVESIAARCDVTCPQEITSSVQGLLAAWQHVDILINNAGVAYYGPTHHMTPQQWQWLLAVNLHAPIQFTHELLPVLLDRDEAHIVNVASIAGLVAGGRFCAYHVTKFGLVGFSEALRAEYGRQGLGITALCPGPVQTNLYRSAACGHKSKQTPTPPAWICTTPERVAEKAIRAIRRDRGLVLVSPLAYVLYYAKRLVPGWLDRLQCVGRRRKMREKAVRLAHRAPCAGTSHDPYGKPTERQAA